MDPRIAPLTQSSVKKLKNPWKIIVPPFFYYNLLQANIEYMKAEC